MSATSSEVTRLLAAASDGDDGAIARLAPLVYEEMKELASRLLRDYRRGQTLRTTGLVHEAYVKLVGQQQVQWEGRSHFLGVAARAMRSILVDYVRARHAAKRGGDLERIPLELAVGMLEDRAIDIVQLDGALTRLAELDERKGRVVELRFFADLTIEETARVLGVSHTTVERDWLFAKAWLHRELAGEAPS